MLDTVADAIHTLHVCGKYICVLPCLWSPKPRLGLASVSDMARKAVGKEPCEGLRLQWLDTFVRLVRTRNQPTVAREIGGSQATVSRQIAALERWLGCVLVKGANPVRLTDDGERFAPIAAEVLDRLRGARVDPSTAAPTQPKISGKDIVI